MPGQALKLVPQVLQHLFSMPTIELDSHNSLVSVGTHFVPGIVQHIAYFELANRRGLLDSHCLLQEAPESDDAVLKRRPLLWL